MQDDQTVRHWIGVAAKDHVERGVAGGFCMFAHGKHEAVKRVRPGDWIAYYSPRTALEGGDEVRAFTAIGQVAQGEPYQAEMAPGRAGWRRDVRYLHGQDAGIYPLLEHLSFIKDPAHWGMAFRRGLFQVPREDFALIAAAMGLTPGCFHRAMPRVGKGANARAHADTLVGTLRFAHPAA